MTTEVKSEASGTKTALRPAQLPMPFELPEQCTFERFIVGGNAELVKRLREPADSFEALWLFGPQGVGKTHLLQALCHDRAGAAYIPAGGIDATSLDVYAWFDVVGVDDVQGWLGDRASETALFALYNRLVAKGATLVFTAERSPLHTQCVVPDLASRLRAANCYAVAPLSDEEKLKMLTAVARRRGFVLGDDVLRFLLVRTSRDQRELLRILDRLDHASLAEQRRITIPFAKEVLCL